MGFASIVSGGEKGKYQIKLDFGKPIVDGQLALIEADLVKAAEKIATAQAKYDPEKAKEAEKYAAVQTALAAYIEAQKPPTEGTDPQAWAVATIEALSAYPKAMAELMEQKRKIAPLLAALEVAKAAQVTLTKAQSYWQGLEMEETREAWCVDYTENATGSVSTVDVPGDSKLILIAPGGVDNPGMYGILWAREVQSAPQLFWNAAVLPGWQKWKPTFRTGVVTAKNDDDTLEVKLDAAKSSAQGLDINQTTTLKKVPAKYLDCDADAFEVDDKCVVQFKGQSWDAPEVIGFVDNPKPCLPWKMEAAYAIPQTQPLATIHAHCTDPELAYDMSSNQSAYVFEFSDNGAPWYVMPIITLGINGAIKNHVADMTNYAPMLDMTSVLPGYVRITVSPDNRPGDLAFRAKKDGKVVMRFAVKNDAALHAYQHATVSGIGIAKDLWPDPVTYQGVPYYSMPFKRFTFTFPD